MDRDEKGQGSSDYDPANTNQNVVEYVGRQGCHHLGYHGYPWSWVTPQVFFRLDTMSSLPITTLVMIYN